MASIKTYPCTKRIISINFYMLLINHAANFKSLLIMTFILVALSLGNTFSGWSKIKLFISMQMCHVKNCHRGINADVYFTCGNCTSIKHVLCNRHEWRQRARNIWEKYTWRSARLNKYVFDISDVSVTVKHVSLVARLSAFNVVQFETDMAGMLISPGSSLA